MAAQDKISAHVSSKGQVVIPKRLRDAKGIKAGSEVEFVGHPEGLLMRLPVSKRYKLADLVGCLPYSGPPASDEKIKEAMEQGMRERWARKEENSRS
jgi:AbrB family looped-hinge helix DNA binding protein